MGETVRERVKQVEAQKRGRLLRLAPILLLFLAGGVWMVTQGQPYGWGVLLFFGSGLIAFPLQYVATLRPSRYAGGALKASRVVGDTLGIAVVAAMAGAGALFIAKLMNFEGRGLILAGGGVLAVLFAVFQLGALFDTRPLVIVDTAGYFDRRWTRRPIPWAQVRRVAESSYRGQTFFRLLTAEEAGEPTLGARFGQMFGISGIGLTAGGLDCTQGDLLAAIAEHVPEAFARAA